jgi:hypothetical protein
MCLPSVVTNDWVVKGCHIHVGAVELRVAPDHKGSVIFLPVFSSTSIVPLGKAIKIAKQRCLPDVNVRDRWKRSLRQATRFMLGYRGILSTKANGRMFEFKLLIIALDRY